MIFDNDKALKVAEFLLQIKAIKLQPNQPFTWASGIKSPIYCDNRISLSYPNVRTYIRQAYAEAILEHYGKPDVIAGVATGGIAQGALIAQELGLPFIYVRSEAKGHGMGNQIEGYFEKGQKVVVIEDLISTGKSSLLAVDALKSAELDVRGLVAIFSYGFQEAITAFENANCPFITLSNYDTLLDLAINQKAITPEELEHLQSWKSNPRNWNI
ncbi:MAG: orotate phosphoribosyltransferase [Crocinitomicaceae bacterium]|jgi:orotate phosphoribosyltransferase|nr:orotate phosphoribosyltransferase [Crocinitomicaceae bacterium]